MKRLLNARVFPASLFYEDIAAADARVDQFMEAAEPAPSAGAMSSLSRTGNVPCLTSHHSEDL